MEYITINNNHKYIYNTYKELKKIMPHNYLKIKILPLQKYYTSNPNLINAIETNYNPYKTNYKNENPKKSIYLFSSQLTDNNISDKNNLKDLFDTKFTYKSKLKKNRTRNKTEINKYFNSETIKTIKNHSLRKIGIFNSNPINNFFLRNNVYLPEITKRMKLKIPRNERETNGFKVIGNELQNYNEKNLKLNTINLKNNDRKVFKIFTNNKKNYSGQKNKMNKNSDISFKIINIINKTKKIKSEEK